jgi:hypothetical protein
MMMMVMLSVEHDDMVPMPVSITDPDPDSDAAYIDTYIFRNDHRFIAGGRRAGKSRHRQKRN